jgi:hypothetical protein
VSNPLTCNSKTSNSKSAQNAQACEKSKLDSNNRNPLGISSSIVLMFHVQHNKFSSISLIFILPFYVTMMPKIMCPIRLTGQTIVLGNCWCHLLSEQSGKKEFNNNVLNMLNIKLIDENLLCCTWNINTMDEEIPKGFLLFESNFDFSQACAFCADFEKFFFARLFWKQMTSTISEYNCLPS